MKTELEKLVGTNWTGTGELWLDPLGNEAHRYECTLAIAADSLRYTWSYEGKAHEGVITPRDGAVTWSDSWHQQTAVEGRELRDAWGLLTYHYTYAAGGPDWGWRTTLSQRPTDELVIQMTNITPWGEEGRAVRMIFTRKA